MVREVVQEPCMVPLDSLKAYDNNAKKHTREQLDAIQASIREFGFRGFVIAWHNESGKAEIVAGHARCKAAQQLGMDEVPVVFCDDLSDAQRRALTLADNQTTMMTGWDEDMLAYELDTLGGEFDMGDFGFDQQGIDFSDLSSMSEETDESREFEEKFKPKRTTDDCYTPTEVYDAVLDWSCSEYGIDPNSVVRPFYPGGDYRSFDYSGGKVVLDNPPFSILAEILDFYLERGIRFFLFAPALTLFSGGRDCSYIATCFPVTYENGAVVSTSFVTNLGQYRIDTAPGLYDALADAQRPSGCEKDAFELPDEVVTAARLGKISKAGVRLQVPKDRCRFIRQLDEQRAVGKSLFGGGFLLSSGAARDKRRAEEEALDARNRKMRERLQKSVSCPRQEPDYAFHLSEREMGIVKELSESE